AGQRPALLHRSGGAFVTVSWQQLASDTRRLAAALSHLGVARGDRVAQISENRYEWIVSDLAIQISGAIHVPLHATLSGAQVVQQIADCGARLAIVSGAEQIEKLAGMAAQLDAHLQLLTVEDCPTPPGLPRAGRWWDLIDRTTEEAGVAVQQEALDHVIADDIATILYTSGTTGEPKGVMLSHANLVSNARATVAAVGVVEDDLRLSFLPWSHVFARTCDLYTWLASGTRLAIAEGRDQILANCAELKPTLLNGVPYFFEKVYRAVAEQDGLATAGTVQKLLGGQMRFCCSGGAALPLHVAKWFQQQQVTLVEGYGLTETSPVISVGTATASSMGTVGRPLPGVEVRIADDGEILTRGPHVMQGYYHRPRATEEVLRDGWLHTGDLGQLDEEGFLKITGRKKEMLVLATGKNVAPAAIEGLLIEDPLILQTMVVGDGCNFLAALIVPDPDALRAALVRKRIDVASREEALGHPEVRALYETAISRQLAKVSSDEQVRRFCLLERGFSIEQGELTPTLKLRRSVIRANFAPAIAEMYRPTS
nr:AMP-binding protein [Planctomycetales bacterium]NIM08823.1 AMP-binding protein [Planctomycetales bacterium]NIN08284.1 AMP-binding protein [Planctomycetales bacterium]NIN77413.1 AMP-binding protein [Planctomycetales bacterium]NIO34587.1 AMP-binding protein [Planctomycetales bacterium]